MSDYLETIYFRDEYSENQYPQKLCNRLIDTLVVPHFGDDLTGKTMLDIGSGKGNHLIGFQRRGFDVCGIDKRKECIEALKDIAISECNLESDNFPFADQTFDVVFSKSVLEHVTNADNILGQALRVLKPNGIALFMTPDWRSQCKYFWDDYTHVKPWTRKGLQNAMKMNGYADVRCSLFRQLPILWKYPWLTIVADLTALLPDVLRWKDAEESEFREWIRFSKEKMLLAVGVKKA